MEIEKSIKDLELPLATIKSLMKNSKDDGESVILSKDSVTVGSRLTGLFILYISSTA